MKNLRLVVAGAVVAVLAIVVASLSLRDAPSDDDPSPEQKVRSPRSSQAAGKVSPRRSVSGKAAGGEAADGTEASDATGMEGDDDGETAPEMTEEEKQADEEEKKVDEFDSAVDKWMEPQGKAVTMAEVDKFRDSFRRVPKSRKEECVHRALNLIPDENVMLLAGILFDKEQDKEILDLVFNDILNRDEEVKKPILQEIFKDKEHPNWADTAWILDVTGELPGASENSENNGGDGDGQ